jgi:hypothetical protein
VRESVVRVALERRGRWLLRRNGAGEAPAGLFEFSALPCSAESSTPAAVAAAVRRSWRLRLANCRELGVVRHQILARSITVRVFAARVTAGPAAPPGAAGEFRWVALGKLAELPVSGAALKIARLLRTVRARSSRLRQDAGSRTTRASEPRA